MPRLIWVFSWRTCLFVGFVMRRLFSSRLYLWAIIYDCGTSCTSSALSYEPVLNQQMSRLMTKPTKWLSASKDSDQPGHLPSLITVFAVRKKKAWVLSNQPSGRTAKTDQTGKRLWSDREDATLLVLSEAVQMLVKFIYLFDKVLATSTFSSR